MSQSSTLYRIAKEEFIKIEKANGQNINFVRLSRSWSSFHGSFMALEYILSKDLSNNKIELIREIFNPGQTFGGNNFNQANIESLNEEELVELFNVVHYLNPDKVKLIDEVLEDISEKKVSESNNAGELNENDIYPCIWRNDNTSDKAYNKPHILNDLKTLKVLFNQASKDNDYILSFKG